MQAAVCGQESDLPRAERRAATVAVAVAEKARHWLQSGLENARTPRPRVPVDVSRGQGSSGQDTAIAVGDSLLSCTTLAARHGAPQAAHAVSEHVKAVASGDMLMEGAQQDTSDPAPSDLQPPPCASSDAKLSLQRASAARGGHARIRCSTRQVCGELREGLRSHLFATSCCEVVLLKPGRAAAAFSIADTQQRGLQAKVGQPARQTQQSDDVRDAARVAEEAARVQEARSRGMQAGNECEDAIPRGGERQDHGASQGRKLASSLAPSLEVGTKEEEEEACHSRNSQKEEEAACRRMHERGGGMEEEEAAWLSSNSLSSASEGRGTVDRDAGLYEKSTPH